MPWAKPSASRPWSSRPRCSRAVPGVAATAHSARASLRALRARRAGGGQPTPARASAPAFLPLSSFLGALPLCGLRPLGRHRAPRGWRETTGSPAAPRRSLRARRGPRRMFRVIPARPLLHARRMIPAVSVQTTVPARTCRPRRRVRPSIWSSRRSAPNGAGGYRGAASRGAEGPRQGPEEERTRQPFPKGESLQKPPWRGLHPATRATFRHARTRLTSARVRE